MTIGQVLKEAVIKLNNYNTQPPHLDTEILLSHLLKKPREYILAHPEKKLTQKQVSSFKFQVARRAKGEPIAYITGHKEFYGLDFFVDKNVLIPRPETELMVDEIMKHKTYNTKHIIFIDVGTGSGCIIITLAKLLKNNIPALPAGRQFLATDISKPALLIARKNAKLHQVDKQIKFLQGDLMEPILKSPLTPLAKGGKIIITANLPYLTPSQIKNSPSIKYEPKLALSAGADGLKYYRKLFKQIQRIRLLPNFSSGSRGFSLAGRLKPPKPDLKVGRIIVLCEIDPSQTTKIKQLIKKELFNAKIQIKKDLRGLNRMVVCFMS
ncbi:peptide chain release factor N(5)-glutamine methyltransferase [Patescibacteria group bacterium]|nr:peptide chain release factor N(5)-glutamine methyltransferase [Patescibacteria group bacterium]